MTSQKDIQSLIADIDSILSKAGSRLHWSMPGDGAAQRRVLEQVRSYLASQQQNVVAAPEKQPTPAPSAHSEAVQPIVQAVTQEFNRLRGDLMQPLRDELNGLRQQRESLVQEIQQLERTRQQLESHTQQTFETQHTLSAFSQELIDRCTESLTQQLNQILREWEVRLVNAESTPANPASVPSDLGVGGRVLQQQERLDRLQQLQVQFDRQLLTLDANQRVIFEALQRSLHSYQDSLSQGLEKMHGLSAQAEMLFSALVNRLAQQLGREASTLLQSSGELSTEPLAGSDRTPQPSLTLESTTANTSPTLHATSGLPTQESFSQAARSEEWEIGEALDFEHLDSELDDDEDVDTFIQLDIEPQASPSSVEAETTPHLSDNQELDSLLSGENEDLIPPSPSVASTEANEAAEQTLSDQNWESEGANESRVDTNSPSDTTQPEAAQAFIPPFPAASPVVRKEIFDLYESLFGTNSAIDTRKSEESSALTPASSDASPTEAESPSSELTNSQLSSHNQTANSDSVTPLSPQAEEVLFEGLADPATEFSQERSRNWSSEPWVESWEALFFEDPAPQSPLEANFVGEPQASSVGIDSRTNWETASDRESFKTIATLMDLFDEMGLSYLLPTVEAASIPATTEQRPDYHPSNPQSQPTGAQEEYPPASPDEDLLATDILEPDPDVEIWLDQDTLEQLQEDLHSFEEPETRAVPVQEDYRSELPTVAPQTPELEQQDQWFPVSEELLAEDWEEFEFNDLSEEPVSPSSEDSSTTELSHREPDPWNANSEEIATASTDRESAGTSTNSSSEAVASDFDPGLFPSETLELDPDGVLSETVTGELITLEDEPFVEMQWDEPADSTTEEIAPSPELESDSDSFSEAILDIEQENVVLEAGVEEPFEPGGEALSEAVENDLADSPQHSTLPQQALEGDLENVPEAGMDVEPQEAIATDEEALNEDVQDESSNSTQEQTSPSQTSDNNSPICSQQTLNSKQEDVESASPEDMDELLRLEELIAADVKALSEDQQIDSSIQEPQTLNEGNFDVDLPRSQTSNLDRPDDQKKKNSGSDSPTRD